MNTDVATVKGIYKNEVRVLEKSAKRWLKHKSICVEEKGKPGEDIYKEWQQRNMSKSL
jgi:hypothetical protein